MQLARFCRVQKLLNMESVLRVWPLEALRVLMGLHSLPQCPHLAWAALHGPGPLEEEPEQEPRAWSPSSTGLPVGLSLPGPAHLCNPLPDCLALLSKPSPPTVPAPNPSLQNHSAKASASTSLLHTQFHTGVGDGWFLVHSGLVFGGEVKEKELVLQLMQESSSDI